MQDRPDSNPRLKWMALPGVIVALVLVVIVAGDLLGFTGETSEASLRSAAGSLLSSALSLLLPLVSLALLWRGVAVSNGRLVSFGYFALIAWPALANLR